MPNPWTWNHIRKNTVFQGLLSVTLTFCLLETVLALFVYVPSVHSVLPKPIRNAMAHLYADRTARHISLLPQCARYDPYTFYTLKPNTTCRFANIEYDTAITINSEGLRDFEKDLREPQVIALGDSFTMGVGVKASQTFVSQLEKMTGTPILNAGISSFGTERELRILRRLDRSRVKTVIVQYAENDRGENAAAIKAGGLNIRSEQDYRRISAKHLRKTDYMPFKLSFYLLRDVIIRPALRSVARERGETADIDEEVAHFAHHLERMREIVPGVRFIVTELNGRDRARVGFLTRLAKRYKGDPSVVIVLVEQTLPGDAYFVIDSHINPKGHRLVAKHLAPHLLRNGGK